MTAIRPRPTPEQQRREEARARAQAQAQAQTRAVKANRILLSQPLFPLVLAIFYIALLIVPWVLECKIANQPSFIIHLYRRSTGLYVQHGWVIAINFLHSLAAVLSLPILSALLARAAVVFSQRRKPGQTLTVRQLFALADRGWYDLVKVTSPVASSALLRLGFLVLLIAALLPLLRSGLVAYDNVLVTDNLPKEARRYMFERLGYTPSPVAVKMANSISQDRVLSATRKNLLTTVGGIEPNLWPVCNDNTSSDSTCGFKYGPYDLSQSTLSNFWEAPDRYGSDSDWNTNGSALMHASTLKAGSSIGSYYWNDFGAYTLGLKSGTRCEAVSAQEVEEQCLRSTDNGSLPTAAQGWNTSLEIQRQLRVDICYPALERSPWEAADASPWKPISFTEHLYIGIRDQESPWDCSDSLYSTNCGYQGTYQGLYLDCQADSMMSFFELGSARTKGVPSRFLEELPSGFDIPRDRGYSSSRDPDSYTDYIGPLKTAALAMFGNDSWFDTLNLVLADIEVANITNGTALAILCQMLPLGNIDTFGRDAYCDEARYRDEFPYYYRSSEIFSSLVRSFFQSFRTRRLARATLNTATFYANNATLSGMNDSPNWESLDTKRVSEESDERMVVPVLSVAAIATISIFVALQVACIVILLVYIYNSRVWTLTLDSLAIARVGAQLSALDVFLIPRETGTLGTAHLNRRATKQLDQIDGLVGSTSLTGQHNDIEMATMPPPYAPRGEEPSTRDERRLPQPGAAAAARDTAARDHNVPAYSPPADEHTAQADETTGERDGANEIATSHAASSEARHLVPPAVTSLEAIAVGGRGLITRRMWRQADKPLPEPPAEQ